MAAFRTPKWSAIPMLGIELTLETAKELRAALDRAIAAAEFEEAEVRGKGAPWPASAPKEPPMLASLLFGRAGSRHVNPCESTWLRIQGIHT